MNIIDPVYIYGGADGFKGFFINLKKKIRNELLGRFFDIELISENEL